MSITDDIKLRLCEEINFDGEGYHIMCDVIDEFTEKLSDRRIRRKNCHCAECTQKEIEYE